MHVTTGGCQILVQPSTRADDENINLVLPCQDAYVELNGQRVFTTNLLGISQIGVNTMQLDPVAGQVSNVKQFNTWGTLGAADDLADYLNSLPKGQIVIGVTHDDPTRHLAAALPTLKNLGVVVDDVTYRGMFAFVLEIGHPERTVYVKSITPAECPWIALNMPGKHTNEFSRQCCWRVLPRSVSQD